MASVVKRAKKLVKVVKKSRAPRVKMDKVVDHLKGDIKNFKHEAHEDRELIKDLKKKPSMKTKKEAKITKVMREYKKGELHSGSKKGPKVKKRDQAIAIALSEAKRMTKKKK